MPYIKTDVKLKNTNIHFISYLWENIVHVHYQDRSVIFLDQYFLFIFGIIRNTNALCDRKFFTVTTGGAYAVIRLARIRNYDILIKNPNSKPKPPKISLRNITQLFRIGLMIKRMFLTIRWYQTCAHDRNLSHT
jgi:hypothetical protein